MTRTFVPHRPLRSRRKTRRLKPSRRIPFLEQLEARIVPSVDVIRSSAGTYLTQGLDANNGVLMLAVADDTNSFINHNVVGSDFQINVKDLQTQAAEDANFSMVYVPFGNAATLGAPGAVYAADVGLRTTNAVVNSGPLPTVLGAQNFADAQVLIPGVGSLPGGGLRNTDGMLMATVAENLNVTVEVPHRRIFAPGFMGLSTSRTPQGFEAEADVATAFFPKAGDWVFGHVFPFGAIAARSDPGDGIFDGTADGDFQLVRIGTGRYTLTIDGVDASSDGVLMTIGGSNEDNVTSTAIGSNWTITVRDNSGNFVENDDFSFVYVPFDAPDLVVKRLDVTPVEVVASQPADGETVIGTAPTTYVLDISVPVDPATVEASDLTVNGTPADMVALSNSDQRLTFTYNTSPAFQGPANVLNVAGGAFGGGSSGGVLRLGVAPFTADFAYDALLMDVVNVSPADGSLLELTGPISIQVDFNEPYDPGSVGTDDLNLSQGSVVDFNFVDADTLEYVVNGLDEGNLTITMPDGAVTDAFGNAGLGFTASYTLDFGVVPYPVPLTPKEPAGSLIYDPSKSGIIDPAGDTDSFTILVDPGQLLTVVVDPSGTGVTLPTLNYDASAPGPSPATQWADTTGVPGFDFNLGSGVSLNPVSDSGFALIDAAYQFDGTNNASAVTSSLQNLGGSPNVTNADASFEIWFRPDDLTDNDVLFETGAFIDGMSLTLLGDTLQFHVNDNTTIQGTLTSTGGVSTSEFNQVVGTIEFVAGGANLALYLNGSQVVAPTFVAGLADWAGGSASGAGTNNANLNIGAGAAGELEGEIALFRFYESALSEAQVSQNFNAVAGLRPTVEVRNQDGDVLGSAAAGAPGESALLDNVPTHGQLGQVGPRPKTYTVTVGGADGTVGGYDLQIILNAAVEDESHGGASNDTLDTAQSLEPAFLPLHGSVVDNDAGRPERTAVLGTIEPATLNTFDSDDFESGALDGQWTTFSSEPQGRIQVTGAFGTAAGSFALLMDRTPSGSNNLNEAIWTVDLSGQTEAVLQFAHADFNDEEFNMPLDFTGHANGDGVAISDDGVNWRRVLNATDLPFGVWQTVKIDLAAEAAAAGMTLGAGFQIKFQQYDNFPLTTDGRGYDEIAIGIPVPAQDFHSFSLTAGESATLAMKGSADLELQNNTGTSLAIASGGASNVDRVISNFIASETGTYYARLSSSSETATDYSLVVTRNAGFDTEGNDDIGSAQDILSTQVAGRQWVLGHIGAGQGVTLHAIDSGWYDSNGFHNPMNTNYIVGLTPPTREFHNFFVFDLSSVSENFVSAELGLFNPSNGYLSVDPSETYTLFDVSTAIPALTAGGSGQFATFDDLGNGVELGSQVISASDVNQLIRIGLNADGAQYLRGNIGGQVALGGAITSLSAGTHQRVFRFTNAGLTRQLTLSSAESDFYRVTLADDQAFEVETRTPGQREGEFVNHLDPLVRLYDATGNLVAEDDNGDPDRRNARLTFNVPSGAGGTYYVEVTGAGATGDYVLAVKHATGGLPAFQVTATDIADGARLRGPTTQMTVDFNDTLLLTSLDASDLTVNGAAATGFTVVDFNTVIFDLPTLTEGLQNVQIAGIQDIQNTPLQTFNTTFFEDLTAPRVVDSSIQENDIVTISGATHDLTYTVTFSEAMRTANLDNSDFSLHGAIANVDYVPSSASYDATGTVLTLEYTGLPEDSYTLTLLSGDGRFEDTADPNGFDLDGEPVAFPIPPNQSGDGVEGGNFVVNFSLDIGTAAFPTPLTPKDPLGSLIYDPSVSGVITPSGDSDTYTINVDAGQTITVLADPASSLRPTLELRDPSNAVVGSATAAANGEDAVIQTVTTVAGTYSIILGGDSGTTGQFSLQVTLNAALELENHNGPGNDTLPTAQDIDGSFIPLLKGATRGAVLGTAGSIALVSEDFEGGSLPASFTTNSDPLGRIRVAAPGGSGNASNFALLMDKSPSGGSNVLNEATFTVDLSGVTQATLSFVHADFNDEQTPLPLDFVGSAAGDGVAISDDGINWRTILNAPNPPSNTWIPFSIDLAAAAAAAGMTLGPNFQIRFQQFDNFEIFTDGRGYDDIVISSPPTPDLYSFTVADNERVTLALDAQTSGNVDLELLNSSGTVLATGSTAQTNVDEMIYNFGPLAAGTYFARVTGDAGTSYSLVVTKDAVFDREANNTFAAAQNFDGVVGSLGYVETTSTVIDHSGGFGDTSGLTANGDAIFTGNLARLTTGGFGQRGSVFFNNRVNVSSFENTFTFQLRPGTSTMADGITFTIQGNSPTALGPAGGGLGYGPDSPGPSRGIRNSVAVKFDIFNNAGEGSNSTGLFTDGRSPTVPEAGSGDVTVNLSGTGIDLRSRNVHRVDMAYNGSVLDVTITDTQTGATAVQSYIVDIPASVGGNTAFVGFTGATGGLTTVADIQTWEFTGGSDGEDWYSVNLTAGVPVHLETVTPADGPGEFVNALDPHIELYDPSGTLVVAGTPLADGRNEEINFTPSAADLYRIRVTAEGGTSGEYFLDPVSLPAERTLMTNITPPVSAEVTAAPTTLIGETPQPNGDLLVSPDAPRFLVANHSNATPAMTTTPVPLQPRESLSAFGVPTQLQSGADAFSPDVPRFQFIAMSLSGQSISSVGEATPDPLLVAYGRRLSQNQFEVSQPVSANPGSNFASREMQTEDAEAMPVEHLDTVFSAMAENDAATATAELTDDTSVVERAAELPQDQVSRAALPLWLVSAMVAGGLLSVPTVFDRSGEEKENRTPEWLRHNRKDSGNRPGF